ncbi:MAG: hypothetical protein OXP71_03670 [Candidatus Poribacteria bacterium]|nr:hypothetical protein [Candidatus Poribacteria bacterium]
MRILIELGCLALEWYFQDCQSICAGPRLAPLDVQLEACLELRLEVRQLTQRIDEYFAEFQWKLTPERLPLDDEKCPSSRRMFFSFLKALDAGA